ncbi:vitamin B12 dependent-methionine synthase activation domain-containing protein, partial [Mesonia mobilis]|uniref:vitamin B12 dependent-methionine synthase activation domain-containing protein n=1 Tax=Mesonia mobilis TaxID=369791 RepID=UPI0026EC52D2
VVGNLLQKETATKYKTDLKLDYAEFREKFLSRTKKKEYLTIAEARENKFQIDWKAEDIIQPKQLGIQVIEDFELKKLKKFIDWTPFFRSWDLHGKFPEILEDEVVGQQATNLFEDAEKMLTEIIQQKQLKAKAVFGLFPANTVENDDISVLDPETSAEIIRFRTLRQQLKKYKGKHNFALADFIAPKETEIQDYIGCFCVTTGFGTQELANEFEKNLDDYNSIMVKALADRLAEAFAEYLHWQVRTQNWGYAKDENLSNAELIKESYKGIRPAPGYPACPDHLEKLSIWKLLNVEENIGVELTESLAMWPAASVSGYYFAHPEARYFGLGKIKPDQVEDFAKRKGISYQEAEKWLNPNLAL